ncbi:hypothetical protein [Halomonas citrativorans]|uniref:Transposase n=1 Tax=Halomonas citrativorans TaxID=2742612 RepID=A0ABR9F975_9GAMM|nr:hypothetical protein [Halomonas citrativorans]MBE0403037.1 hypothetical protein [Halomonas citrativorans]
MIAIHQGTKIAFSAIYRRLVINQLINRVDSLESEKYGLITENKILATENAKLRRALAEQHNDVA